jgi:hypothetical protein
MSFANHILVLELIDCFLHRLLGIVYLTKGRREKVNLMMRLFRWVRHASYYTLQAIPRLKTMRRVKITQNQKISFSFLLLNMESAARIV